MKTRSYRNSPLAVLAALALVLGACSDSMTEAEDEHAEPDGVELALGGQVIASYDGDTQTWSPDHLEVDEHQGHITVTFVDHEGDPIPIDDDLYLEVDSADPSIAEFEQDTPGEFGGHLHGEMEGETDLTFKLMHGAVGSGHADFVTQGLEVHVH